jgi:hypothetical protein
VQPSTKINKNILAIKSNQIIKIVIKIKRKGDKSEKQQQVTVKQTTVSKSVVNDKQPYCEQQKPKSMQKQK